MRLILICLLMACFNAEAANYFRWGWEDTRPSFGVNGRSGSNVTYYSGTPVGAASARDCTVAHSGSCSMKLTVIGNDGNNQGLGVDLVASLPAYPFNIVRTGPSLYYRWWMRIETGFSWGAGTAKTKASRVSGPSSARTYTGYLYSDGVYIAECDGTTGCKTNAGGSNSDDHSIGVAITMSTYADSTWHEWIVQVKPNTSGSCTVAVNCDAELRVWVDNVLIGSNTGWRLSSITGTAQYENWGGWMVSPYFQIGGTVSDGGTIYIDDVSTDTSFNHWVAPATLSVLDTGRFMATNMGNWKSLHPYL